MQNKKVKVDPESRSTNLKSESGFVITFYKCKSLKGNARKCLTWYRHICQNFTVLKVRLGVGLFVLFHTKIFLFIEEYGHRNWWTPVWVDYCVTQHSLRVTIKNITGAHTWNARLYGYMCVDYVYIMYVFACVHVHACACTHLWCSIQVHSVCVLTEDFKILEQYAVTSGVCCSLSSKMVYRTKLSSLLLVWFEVIWWFLFGWR